jgi:hypothetical protein
MDLELGDRFRDSVVVVPLTISITTPYSLGQYKSRAEILPSFYKLARSIEVVQWADFSGKRMSSD